MDGKEAVHYRILTNFCTVSQILGVDRSFIGGLGFGLTACDPATMTVANLPDDADMLLDRPEYWVVNKDVCRTPEVGDELAFAVTSEGENSVFLYFSV
jgi:protein neuralized